MPGPFRRLTAVRDPYAPPGPRPDGDGGGGGSRRRLCSSARLLAARSRRALHPVEVGFVLFIELRAAFAFESSPLRSGWCSDSSWLAFVELVARASRRCRRGRSGHRRLLGFNRAECTSFASAP